MKKFFQSLSGGFIYNGEKKAIETLKLCTNHDQSLYPNLLANETVVHLNKKVCYICSSKYVKMGQMVECRAFIKSLRGLRYIG